MILAFVKLKLQRTANRPALLRRCCREIITQLGRAPKSFGVFKGAKLADVVGKKMANKSNYVVVLLKEKREKKEADKRSDEAIKG